jgi:hypothetical protein
MRAILLPNGNLLIPAEPGQADEGVGVKEIGADHSEYRLWLASAEPGEDPRLGKGDPRQQFLRALDRTLERRATDLYGPLGQEGPPPSLAAKLAVFVLLAVLLALGLATVW